jgi:hypothetical protein
MDTSREDIECDLVMRLKQEHMAPMSRAVGQ